MNKLGEECLTILKDFRDNEIGMWEWDEDYYNSGLETREERIKWAQDRLDVCIDAICEIFNMKKYIGQ